MTETHLAVGRTLRLPLAEIQIRVSRSSGPGGQHANKTATRVEAVFDAAASDALGPVQRRRIVSRTGGLVSAVAQDSRSQSRNRELALLRLGAKLEDALATRRSRIATKPTRSANERRLADKRATAERKSQRRPPSL